MKVQRSQVEQAIAVLVNERGQCARSLDALPRIASSKARSEVLSIDKSLATAIRILEAASAVPRERPRLGMVVIATQKANVAKRRRAAKRAPAVKRAPAAKAGFTASGKKIGRPPKAKSAPITQAEVDRAVDAGDGKALAPDGPLASPDDVEPPIERVVNASAVHGAAS